MAIRTANDFMIDWLNDFAYRIELNLWFFAIPGLATLFIAIATVSYHSINAAIANPIGSIKHE